MDTSRFAIGDRVELVKKFYCSGDSAGTDTTIDSELRKGLPAGALPTGIVTDPYTESGYVQVEWTKANGHCVAYVCEQDVVEHENFITPEDEEAAIASILQALKP